MNTLEKFMTNCLQISQKVDHKLTQQFILQEVLLRSRLVLNYWKTGPVLQLGPEGHLVRSV